MNGTSAQIEVSAPTTKDSPTPTAEAGEPPAALCRQGALSVAFQDPCLLPWLTVRQNIALGRKLARLPADPAMVDHLIEVVGLGGFHQARPAALSGGMRQRIVIAMALLCRSSSVP